MTNTIREKMEKMATYADIIDRMIALRESYCMEWYKDDDGNTGYRDYEPESWGDDFCDRKKRDKEIFDEVIKTIEKLAVK